MSLSLDNLDEGGTVLFADPVAINLYLKRLPSDELRLAVLNKFCKGICRGCGRVTNDCNCMNDD
jgi:hypothetical protein